MKKTNEVGKHAKFLLMSEGDVFTSLFSEKETGLTVDIIKSDKETIKTMANPGNSHYKENLEFIISCFSENKDDESKKIVENAKSLLEEVK